LRDFFIGVRFPGALTVKEWDCGILVGPFSIWSMQGHEFGAHVCTEPPDYPVSLVRRRTSASKRQCEFIGNFGPERVDPDASIGGISHEAEIARPAADWPNLSEAGKGGAPRLAPISSHWQNHDAQLRYLTEPLLKWGEPFDWANSGARIFRAFDETVILYFLYVIT
jgi:hypothetical protein